MVLFIEKIIIMPFFVMPDFADFSLFFLCLIYIDLMHMSQTLRYVIAIGLVEMAIWMTTIYRNL